MGDKRRDVEVMIFNGVEAREEGATLGHAPTCPDNRTRRTTYMNEQREDMQRVEHEYALYTQL